jgi:hypothetical protein
MACPSNRGEAIMGRPITFVLAAALAIAAISFAQAAAPRDPVQARVTSVTEFSAAAKRTRHPYEGRATVYNPRGVSQEPWGPPSSPGTYGGGF